MATQYYLMRGVYKPYAITDDKKFIGGLHLEKWLNIALPGSTAALKASPVFTGQTTTAAGVVASPGLVVGVNDNGFFEVSTTQINMSIGNASVAGWNAAGLMTNAITELTAGQGITFSKATIRKYTATAINSTGAATAAQLAGGLITSTSGAATAITLPTASLLATQLGAVQGTVFEFVVDNSAGSNTVTVTMNTGITAATAVLTGADTMTVLAAKVGIFRIYFVSATGAVIYRAG